MDSDSSQSVIARTSPAASSRPMTIFAFVVAFAPWADAIWSFGAAIAAGALRKVTNTPTAVKTRNPLSSLRGARPPVFKESGLPHRIEITGRNLPKNF